MNVSLPLESQIYLTGPDDPERTCAACLGGTPGACGSGTCMRGPRHGLPCTPETSALNASYPTSHDCPPFNAPNGMLGTCGISVMGSTFIGCLPIGFDLSTGTQTLSSFNTGQQQRVLCGFCFDGDATLSFERPPRPCSSDAECTSGDFRACRQHSPGAFRNAFATTVTETGSAPHVSMADGAPHDLTLAGVFCIPPSYDPIVDPTGELPGPGAVSLPGKAQFIP
jgi:hypothetical protein